ncbi:MAG: LamG-like jellyroll fold domain-containing protein [Bacteroidota bacterium]
MYNHLKGYVYGVCCVLLFLAGHYSLHAQNHGILRMESADYAAHFHTGIDLQQPLDLGTPGQATVEFWIRSTFEDNRWELTDLLEASHALSLKMHTANQLKVSVGTDVQEIDLSGEVNGRVAPITWHHVTITFQTGVLRIYMNGSKRFEKNMALPEGMVRNLFFRKEAGSTQEIAEVRVWTKKRTDEEIEESWLRSFNASDATLLRDLENQGLYALIGAYDKADHTVHSPVENIRRLRWDNLLDNPSVRAGGVSLYRASGVDHQLMQVREDIEHPVLQNTTIHLSASKGSHPDKVQLKWNHIKGATGYVITKGVSNIQIGSEAAGSRAVGDPIVFDVETDILPGNINSYKVQAQGEVNSSGTDYGFIFHNGKISGIVQSSSQVGTPGVAVTFRGEELLPGKALQFAPGTSPVIVKNASIFRQSAAARDFLVEFWHRSDGDGNHRIFSLGQLAVEMQGRSTIRVLGGDGSEYLTYSSRPADGQWHHYAIAFTPSGGLLYEDGTLVATHTHAYTHDGIASVDRFVINAQAESPYTLDELRIWDASRAMVTLPDNTSRPETDQELNERLSQQVTDYWRFKIGGKEKGLLLYYRFDMESPYEVYNQAETTKGEYVGTSEDEITRRTPLDLAYAVYTDRSGNYIMEAINYGDASVSLIVEPVRTNHTFTPTIRTEILQSSTHPDDYTRTAVAFTDESQFNVSGNVFYELAGTNYPVPAGQTFEFASGVSPQAADYRLITNGDGQNVATDHFGQYNLSLPIGLQNFRVANRLRSRSFGSQSLLFDGENDYAKSSGTFFPPVAGTTWSGWIKKGEYDGPVPEWQTILQMGGVQLALRDNNHLTLRMGAEKLAEVPFADTNDWQFFAFAYDQGTGTTLLYADENNQATSGIVNATVFGGTFYLGMSNALEHPLKGHLHLIEQRNTYYSEGKLTKLKDGTFIEGDEQHLSLSYRFSESDVSLRAVSSTAGSEGRELTLLNESNDESAMPRFDATMINPYTRQYRYHYEAQGTYAIGELQKWNVTEPASSVDFYNLTRYGITGNVIIPCNHTLGTWEVAVERTDVVEPKFIQTFTGDQASAIFNNDGSVFTVDGLLPGLYKVTITNQDDPSIEREQFGVDLRQGWATVDFEYRSPLQVEARIIAIQGDDANMDPIWQPFDATSGEHYCATADRYILRQQTQYQVRLEFYEEYGGNKCYVDDTEYYLAGDLQQYHGQLGTNIVQSSADNPFTSVGGIDTVLVWTNYPNFTGDYSRLLDIQVTSRNAGHQLAAWVTGTLQDENQNFSLTPLLVTQVLYDPPGDGSSISWSSGASSDYATSWSHDHAFTAATKITTGKEHKAYMGAWAGVGIGGGSIVLYESTKGEITAGGEVGTTHSINRAYDATYSVSFDQAVSTNDGTALLPGAQSDIFIGTSNIVYFAPGKTLSVTNCEASYVAEANTGAIAKGAEFVYSRYGIESTLIPNLQGVIAALRGQLQNPEAESVNRETLSAADQGKVDTIKNYLADIENWNGYLKHTLDARQAVIDGTNAEAFTLSNRAGSKSLPIENQALSGAVSRSYSIGADGSSSKTLSHRHEIDLTKYIQTGLTAFSVKFNLDITLNTKQEASRSTGGGTSENKSFSIHLSDDDPDDQFDVLFRQDARYPTPVIVAKAGQSSCPVEPHTVAREGVELAVTESTVWAGLDEEAVFEVDLRDLNKSNEGVNQGLSRTYELYIPPTRLPSGAFVRVDGLSNWPAPRTYVLEPGESKKVKVYVRRENATSPTEFINIPLAFYSACDADLLDFYGAEKVQVGNHPVSGKPIYEFQRGVDRAAVVYNSDGSEYVRLRDVKHLTARFHEPCAGNIDVAAPLSNWVVNSASGDQLSFRFRPETAHSTFEKVRFQFALENSDDVRFSKDVAITELGTPDEQGYYRYHLNTEAIGADQIYRVRIVPVCGDETEGWQTNNPTRWIKGSMRRSLPAITSFTPLDGAITTDVTASATFNRRLDNGTVNPLNISLRGILSGVSYEPKSAWFDQVADRITIQDQDILDLESSYTIEFWVRPDKVHSASVQTPLIEKGGNLHIAFTNGNYLYAGQGSAISTSPIDTDGWTHVAVVYRDGDASNTLSIYFNGILDHTVSAGIVDFTTNEEPLTIARANGLEGFIGGLDEIRIWNKALSEATIRTNKDKRLIGTEDGLQAYYVLDDRALEPEAIRDFTGRTRGSTATGLSFVTKDDAAPMDIATVIQDIPLVVNASADQTQVFMRPVASYPAELLEGALLTATIHDGMVRDEFGNLANGHSWTFRVDKNHIEWDKGNHTQVQVAGTRRTFDLTLMSENASQVTYELIDLPMWLEVANPEPQVNGYYILPSGNQHTMTFTTASWLSAGTYTGQVKAKIIQGASLLGIETVDIRVIVSCDASHLEVVTGGYVMSANLTIEAGGENYVDGIGKTVLVRNDQGTLVGKGIIRDVGGVAMASFNSYAATPNPPNPVYQVYLWNDAICQEVSIGEVTFVSGSNASETLDLNHIGKMSYTIPLGEAGYYWLSFRASDSKGGTTLSLGHLSGFGDGDRIETHGMGARQTTHYDGANWSVDWPLSVTHSYLVYVAAPRAIQVTGYPVASNYPVTLAASSGTGTDADNNATGYLRNEAMTVAQAFSRMRPAPSIGDLIISHQGNARFTLVAGVGTWVGSLTHLIPNQGYKIKVSNAATIRYSSTSSSRVSATPAAPALRARNDAGRLGITVAPRMFAYATHLTGVIAAPEELLTAASDYLLVAFSGKEPRGVAAPQYLEGRWYYFLTAYGNDPAEDFTFKWIAREDGRSYAISNTIGLQSSVLTGTVADPYILHVKEELQESPQGVLLLQNVPNPVRTGYTEISYQLPMDGDVSLSITTLQGQLVKSLAAGKQQAGRYTVRWDTTNEADQPVAAGVYLYTLQFGKEVLTRRILIH